jgi:hypothetical protein
MNKKTPQELLNEFELVFTLAQSKNDISLIQELLKNQNLIDKEVSEIYLQAALFHSVKHGYLAAVDYLLTSSDLSENPSLSGIENPLKISAKNGYLNIFKYFTENFEKYYPESQLDIVFFGLISDASEHGKLNIVEFIINHSVIKSSRNLNKFEMHSTQWACLKGHLNVVEFHFPKGTDKKFEDNFFLNAVSGGHFDIAKYCVFDLNIPFSEHLQEALILFNDEQHNKVKDFFNIRELNQALNVELYVNEQKLEKKLSSAKLNKKKVKL